MSEEAFFIDEQTSFAIDLTAMTMDAVLSPVYHREFGLKPAEVNILLILSEEGICTQGTLIRRTGTYKMAVSRFVRRLEDRNLVCRAAYDGRADYWRLSVDGVQVSSRAIETIQGFEATILSGLSDDERRLVRDLLRRIRVAGKAACERPKMRRRYKTANFGLGSVRGGAPKIPA